MNLIGFNFLTLVLPYLRRLYHMENLTNHINRRYLPGLKGIEFSRPIIHVQSPFNTINNTCKAHKGLYAIFAWNPANVANISIDLELRMLPQENISL